MTKQHGAFAAEVGRIIFNDKAPKGTKILLLTEGMVTQPGHWEDGKGYLGWCPMPIIDKAELAACLANPHNGFYQPKAHAFYKENCIMNMQPVVSSNVKAVGHDGKDTMRVEFTHGGVYDYSNVSEEKFKSIVGAESVGKALQPIKNDKATYPYVKV